MRFSDFLKATVFSCAGCATALATVSVLAMTRDFDTTRMYIGVGWWIFSAALGAWIGRSHNATAGIARLLASAKSQTILPDLRPGMTLLNRLWPLIIATLAAGVIGVFIPQVATIAAGFTIIWALAWRHQQSAVAAIEERDGARFYVQLTSPFIPIVLVRTPGFGGSFLGYQGQA